MKIKTQRLLITEFTPDMAHAVHAGSLDADTRRFLPDEVFETETIAAQAIADLINCYDSKNGPFVYPMLLQGEYVGYVQLVSTEAGFEVGYHTVLAHTGKGYATEAVTAFLPAMMQRLGLTEVMGVCIAENHASIRVLEKCGFVRTFEGKGCYQGTVRPIVRMVYRFTPHHT